MHTLKTVAKLRGTMKDWATFKLQVAKSRELIAFPFFERHAGAMTGIGLDVGCGDGDLTDHLSRIARVDMVGIDVDDDSLGRARCICNSRLHFVKGDIEKNSIPSLGVEFDFAVSNCCLPHISETGVYRVLTDLYSSLRQGGAVIILVPSIEWAKNHYPIVSRSQGGVAALPRYGGVQHFRIPAWYTTALAKCGFKDIEHTSVCIPSNDQLEERYRRQVGAVLYDSFVARRAEAIPDIDLLKKAFEIAHENRKLEIGLFWQRSLFFWGFVASALVGYGAAYGKSNLLSTVLALFGFVCSVVWAAGNRGSKYWQEYWEEKVSFLQHYTTGNIFYDRTPKRPRILEHYAARRVSVSKLTMALSDFAVFLWFVLCIATIARVYLPIPTWAYSYLSIGILVGTLVYSLVFLRNSKSED